MSNSDGGVEIIAETSFDEAIFECIEKALEPLGSNARESILRLFEAKTRVPRKKIPYNVDAFLTHLQNLFGKPATNTLQMAMKREIVKRFDLSGVPEGDISELIEAVKVETRKLRNQDR